MIGFAYKRIVEIPGISGKDRYNHALDLGVFGRLIENDGLKPPVIPRVDIGTKGRNTTFKRNGIIVLSIDILGIVTIDQNIGRHFGRLHGNGDTR